MSHISSAVERFSQALASWPIKNIIQDKKLDILEIGVLHGDTALWCLQNLHCNYTGIDRYKQEGANRLGKYPNARFICGQSQDVLAKLEPETFDLIFIDGCHMAPTILSDSVVSWRLLRHHGVMIWDDYFWSCNQKNKKDEWIVKPLNKIPKLAIDAFLSCYHEQYRMLFSHYMIGIQKGGIEDQ